MPIDEQNIETVEDADALLATIEQPDPSAIQDSPPQAVLPDEIDFPIEDKKMMKVKRDQLFQWAQQGRTAPGKMSQLTREIESYKKKLSEEEPKWQGLQKKYGEIDDYVRQNPQFWDHVTQSYQNKNQALNDGNNPLAGVVTDLQSKIQDLIQFKNQTVEEQTKHRTSQEDKAYISQLEEIKKKFSDLDFVTPDEEGKTLELRVLEHATKNNIGNFEAALKDLKFDDLTKLSAEKAKESLTKEKLKNSKLGILGITAQPTKRSSSDHKGKSWNSLSEEIIDEYKLT